MYWPVGTPRVYATSSTQTANFNLVVSHDGLQPPPPAPAEDSTDKADKASLLTSDSASASSYDIVPPTPVTPITPATPGINSVEHDSLDSASEASTSNEPAPVPAAIPLKEPILALRVARPGHLFAVITATSMTIWQAKVRCRLRPSPRVPTSIANNVCSPA